jgi:hypothetical protein
MTEKLTTYVLRLFGAELHLAPFDGVEGLPYLLRGNYDFYLATLTGQRFLLLCDRRKTALTPRGIAKHLELAARHAELPAVYATESMVAYNRDRLLKQHVPFIVPERQLYLPFLHAAFSEAKNKNAKEFTELGTLAQLLILGRLNRKFTESLSIAMAKERFGYSKISVIRAFDELEFFHLAERSGYSKRLTFPMPCQKLWETALPLLKNPCRRVIGLENLPEAISVCVAGANALAERTMLAESERLEYAVLVGQFNRLGYIQTVPSSVAPVLLQLWTYPPDFLTRGKVDPFSLYLTLKNESDERIQIALDELMNGVL